MAKMWEIREGYDVDERHGNGYEEGFEDGCEYGYRKAMKESGMFGMRENMGRGRMNSRYMGGSHMPPYPSFRDDFDDDDEMGMRRRRDSRGRYM